MSGCPKAISTAATVVSLKPKSDPVTPAQNLPRALHVIHTSWKSSPWSLKSCIWHPRLWPWKSPTLLPPLTPPMSSRSCCSYHTRPCFCPRAFAQVVSSVRTPSPWYLHDLLHHFLLTSVTLSVRSLLTTLFKMASSHLSLSLCVSVSALLLCMSFITIDRYVYLFVYCLDVSSMKVGTLFTAVFLSV